MGGGLRAQVAACSILIGLAASGRAGEYVDWLDDGTVLLKLGRAYGQAVIETSRAELGPLLGNPETKPYAGRVVHILSQNEGPHGAISGPLTALAPVFEELSGAHVELGLVPVTELYSTLMLDLGRGTAHYDAAVVAAFYYGELIHADAMRPVDEFARSGSFPAWSYDAMPPALRLLHHWGDTGYGVPNDADGQVLYYRRDVLNDPAWRELFKQARGYDMTAPPRTWQQVLDIAKFFDGKNWDPSDSRADRGMVMHLKPGEQGHYHFQSLAAAFTITPVEGGPPAPFWFDPTTMRPLIDDPGHVAALEMLQALGDTGPGEQLGWRLPEAWSYFLRGKAVFMFSWGDLGALCQDPEAGRLVRGKCATAVLPGSTRRWDGSRQSWIESDDPPAVGNTTGGSWHGVVLKQAQEPEIAYAFLSLMATKPVSLWNVQHGWTGINPGFDYQFPPPAGTGRLADYVKAGWDLADARDYLAAYHATFNEPLMLPYLRIRGTPEYFAALDASLAAAMSRRKTAAEALADVAQAWEAITERLGHDRQLELYRAALGYPGGSG